MNAEQKHVFVYGGGLIGVAILFLWLTRSDAISAVAPSLSQPSPANPDWGSLYTVPDLNAGAPAVTNINLGQVPIYVPTPSLPRGSGAQGGASCGGCCGDCGGCAGAGALTTPDAVIQNTFESLQTGFRSLSAWN